jgi:hypothetical protein
VCFRVVRRNDFLLEEHGSRILLSYSRYHESEKENRLVASRHTIHQDKGHVDLWSCRWIENKGQKADVDTAVIYLGPVSIRADKKH